MVDCPGPLRFPSCGTPLCVGTKCGGGIENGFAIGRRTFAIRRAFVHEEGCWKKVQMGMLSHETSSTQCSRRTGVCICISHAPLEYFARQESDGTALSAIAAGWQQVPQPKEQRYDPLMVAWSKQSALQLKGLPPQVLANSDEELRKRVVTWSISSTRFEHKTQHGRTTVVNKISSRPGRVPSVPFVMSSDLSSLKCNCEATALF